MVIEQVVERWHRFVTGGPLGDLDGLLADDVVFLLADRPHAAAR